MTNPRILIIEDDHASRDVLTQMLEHQQFAVDSVINAEDALQLLGKQQYALAIVDLALPGMDGWQLLGEIQRNPGLTAMKSIALTAYYEPMLAKQARQAGFIDCFPKPITNHLLKDIKSILG